MLESIQVAAKKLLQPRLPAAPDLLHVSADLGHQRRWAWDPPGRRGVPFRNLPLRRRCPGVGGQLQPERPVDIPSQHPLRVDGELLDVPVSQRRARGAVGENNSAGLTNKPWQQQDGGNIPTHVQENGSQITRQSLCS